jgi:hypothetical protein
LVIEAKEQSQRNEIALAFFSQMFFLVIQT